MRKWIGMYKSCVTFCHLRAGVYNINCVNTRTFSVISQTSIDRNRNNGHGFGFSHIPVQQNHTSTRGLHMVAKTPLVLTNNRRNLPNLKPQIRHATLMEKYVNFLSNNAVVEGCEKCLLYVHNLTGLPWWIDIVLTALVVNLTLKLPLTVFAMKQDVKIKAVYEKLKLSMPQLAKDCKIEMIRKKLGPDETKRLMKNMYKEKKRELFIEDNCHPGKVTVAEISKIPLLLGISIAFRNLSGNSVVSVFSESGPKSQELLTDGILWFPNLAIPDPYFILPVLLGAQSLIGDHIKSDASKGMGPGWAKYALGAFSIFFMFIATVCPTCMVLYWICNGFFGNVIRIGCRLPQVRMFFKVGQATQPLKTNPSISRFVKAINEKKK